MTWVNVSVPGSGYSGYPICQTYEDRTPILALISEVSSLAIATADVDAITGEEVAFARVLAEQAHRYARECAWFAERQAADRSGAGGAGRHRMTPAGGGRTEFDRTAFDPHRDNGPRR